MNQIFIFYTIKLEVVLLCLVTILITYQMNFLFNNFYMYTYDYALLTCDLINILVCES